MDPVSSSAILEFIRYRLRPPQRTRSGRSLMAARYKGEMMCPVLIPAGDIDEPIHTPPNTLCTVHNLTVALRGGSLSTLCSAQASVTRQATSHHV
ncbi:hypothetical protein ElyMa_006474300 [Elysia marginata]|uniref:Uncharacterized protein n=1 Tax=Elysia marginata TaxID=1093978 RepID=A0AAV4I0A0_9GAST|nr:hypothetical protein ElyMa_006474300 [Elysia marginata]